MAVGADGVATTAFTVAAMSGKDSSTVPMISLRLKGADDDAAAAGGGGAGGGGRGPLGLGRASHAFRDGGTSCTSGGGGNGGGRNGGGASPGTGAAEEAAFEAALGAKGTGL